MSIWILAIMKIATSSGREVVQVKMLNKLKQDKLNSGAIEPEQVDELELPAEEKSDEWKGALITYSVAMPLILASPIMLYIFKDEMLRGEICKFYELSLGDDNEAAQLECVKNYEGNEEFYLEQAGLRYYGFFYAVVCPLFFGTWEFFQNQLLISWRHIIYQYIFTAFYALITYTW